MDLTKALAYLKFVVKVITILPVIVKGVKTLWDEVHESLEDDIEELLK